jgi:hypothetical protein
VSRPAAVRSRVIDVLTLGGIGAALLFFALIVPPPSWPLADRTSSMREDPIRR